MLQPPTPLTHSSLHPHGPVPETLVLDNALSQATLRLGRQQLVPHPSVSPHPFLPADSGELKGPIYAAGLRHPPFHVMSESWVWEWGPSRRSSS